MRRLVALVAASLAAGALVAVPASGQEQAPSPSPEAGAAPVEPRASLSDIEDEVMCPICGVPLELAIDAPQAQRQREFIRELIAQGKTKEEIKEALVAEFGEEVLAVPETEGFDLAAWLVPGAAILAAAVAILFALRRWRGEGRGGGSDELGAAARDPSGARAAEEERRRLDADLARYEL